MSHYDCKKCGAYPTCDCDKPVEADPKELMKTITESMTENPWSDELPDEFTVVESGDWTDSHKSESKTDIVRHNASNQFFQIELYRTGDHWQGYETEFVEVFQVSPYVKSIIAYSPIKAGA
ncbi:hypothetical protein FNPHOIGM_00012 [Dickeya phage DchS19]|uniref:Uncharacterized protein n=1 Tax=Dickeya phage DchS19 TaxID=2951194 RepID=A0A9E7S5C4_9CAUD|nr:hypothetical protein FNPHOIGM_00012 [Dickeya phage DchS19]